MWSTGVTFLSLFFFIELYFDRGNAIKFTALVRELEPPGVMTSNKTYAFDFNTEKPYETYSGMNTRLRYFLRVTITKSYNNNFVKEQDFLVHNVTAVSNASLRYDKIMY